MKRDVIRRLAVGGTSEIFLARERGAAGVGRFVVVKRPRADRAAEQVAEMLTDEARVLALLEHPHIVRLYGVDPSHPPELVLEYLDGPSLAQLLAALGGPPPLAATLDVGLAVGEALDFAHTRMDERGRPLAIVHRDLTPRNVIVTSQGVVKVIDFGVAQARSNVYETATGVARGTPRYMAPEQIEGGPVDARADVYALGALLYELTTGAHPYAGTAGVHLHRALTEIGMPRLLEQRPDVDPRYAALVDRCTRIDPGERPASMAELVAELAALRQARPEPRLFSRLAALVLCARG